MNRFLTFSLLLLAFIGSAFHSVAPAARRTAPVAYRFDPAASRLTWTGYAETGSYAPSGTIRLSQGTLLYDGRTVRQGRCEIDMNSLQHENSTMQEHLRGDDFFAVKRFPTAVFELDKVAQGQATGRLTLHGITRPVRFPLSVTAQPGGELRLQGLVTLDRTQFDVKFNSSSFFTNLGDQAIRNDFTLAFDAVARPAAPAKATAKLP